MHHSKNSDRPGQGENLAMTMSSRGGYDKNWD